MQPPPRLDLGNPPQKPQSQSMMPPPPHFPPPPYREEAAAPAQKKTGLARILPTIVTLSAFGGLALLAWFAYQEGKAPIVEEELPVIKAEEESYKRVPENPGGEEIPHTDKEVYNSFTSDKPLAEAKKAEPLPDAEQPIDRAFLKQFGESGDEGVENEAKQESVEFGKKAVAAAAAAATEEAPLEPKPLPLAKADEALPTPTPNTGGVEAVKEVAVEKPAQALADAAEKMIAAEPEKAEEPALPPIPKEAIKKVEAAKKPETEKKVAVLKKPEVTKKEVVKPATTVAPSPVKTAPVKMGKGPRVQLGAFRSEAEASREWKKMQAKYKTSLGNLSMMVQKVEIPNKGTMYRVQAGPLASKDAARTLCKKLVAAGQGCFIAK